MEFLKNSSVDGVSDPENEWEEMKSELYWNNRSRGAFQKLGKDVEFFFKWVKIEEQVNK